LRERAARVARSTSGLTLVATSGPDHSRIPGMTAAEVLKLPVGPKISTEWQSSAASSRRPSPGRPGVRPRITRPGVGPATVSRRSSRPFAHTEPRPLCSRPGRWPAAPPGRCRTTAAVPLAVPPTTVAVEAYMPTGPGSAPWAWAGQAIAGSPRWWGRLHSTAATSATPRSSQVWPNTSPASCPEAQASSPTVPVTSSP
jgi:hypothetical protein